MLNNDELEIKRELILTTKNGKYYVGDIEIKCPVCGGTEFRRTRNVTNSRLMTFFSLDWLDSGANVLRCVYCNHLMWFQNFSNGGTVLLMAVIVFGLIVFFGNRM